MTYLSAFQQGNLVLPSALYFHFQEIFSSSEDFLVWQFFYLQNTTALEEIEPSQIAESIGKTVSEVNRIMSQNVLKDLVETFQQELGRLLTPFEIEDLTKTIQEDKTNPDLVKAALREAVFNGKANWKYIQAILRNWRREGITTLAQVEAKREEREAFNPQNVTVSDDFLRAMDLWKD